MLISGLLLERIGPRYAMLIGGLLACLGYTLLWVSSTRHLPPSITLSCMTLYLSTFGASFFSVTCTTLAVANFPLQDRGKSVGVMKGFLGLGISINSQVYSTFFNSIDYLLGLAIGMPLVGIMAALVVNIIPRRYLEYSKDEYYQFGSGNGGNEGPPFAPWFLLIFITSLYVGAAVFVNADFPIPHYASTLLFIPTVLLAFVGVAFLPLQYGPLKRHVGLPLPQNKHETKSLLEKETMTAACSITTTSASSPTTTCSEVETSGKSDEDDGGNDANLLQMAGTMEFWLLFCLFCITSGVCLTVVNNIAALIDSFDSMEGEAVPLMLFGVFETAGRLSLALSDIFRHSLARIFLLDAAVIVLFICCLVLAFDNIYTLNLCVIVVSYCYGFLYADISAIVADLFGVRHFGGNLGFTLLAPIIGSFAIASGIIGALYVEGCGGSTCFRYVFLADAVLCLIAMGILLVLKFRLMDRYGIPTLAAVFKTRQTILL